jgi:hypothetical protein
MRFYQLLLVAIVFAIAPIIGKKKRGLGLSNTDGCYRKDNSYQ